MKCFNSIAMVTFCAGWINATNTYTLRIVILCTVHFMYEVILCSRLNIYVTLCVRFSVSYCYMLYHFY